MQGKRLLFAMLGGLATVALTPSFAAVISVPDGWYVEGNVGITKISDRNYPGPSSNSSNGYGANLNIGYKFMPYFAGELGYTRYSDIEIKDQFGTKAGADQHYAVDLVGKGILPLVGSGAEAFAKVGLQRLNSRIVIDNATAAANIGLGSTSRSTTGLYFGTGIQYNFVPEMAANIQWMRAVGNNNTGTLDLFSIGISFIFS